MLSKEIAASSDSCVRQLAAWTAQIERGPIQGKRHLTVYEKTKRQAAQAKSDLRHQFLHTLTPDHPLYDSEEAGTARTR